jgi:hypothetical protein
MGVLGDVSKGFIVFSVIVGAILIVEFILLDQLAIATLILVGLLIPISFTALEYRKNFRKFQCNKCKHDFKVSYLRLLFTRSFRGRDAPTATTAYYLKCPQCGDKSWFAPSQQP